MGSSGTAHFFPKIAQEPPLFVYSHYSQPALECSDTPSTSNPLSQYHKHCGDTLS